MAALALSLTGLAVKAGAVDEPQSANLGIQGPFGIGSCAARTGALQSWLPQMTAIGIRDLRSSTGCWGVEKEKGVWTWETLDSRLAYCESIGIRTGLTFNGRPKWSSTEKGLPMNILPEWSEMVARTVKHAKGRIKYYEVWNEPPNGTAKGQTAADYAKVVCATYDSAKQADPDCLIGLAAKSVAVNYLDQAIAAGAKGHFDYITLHPYETAGCVVDRPGTEPVYLQIAPTVRKMLAARDMAKVNCPIIFTELGYAAGGQYNKGGPDTQAHAVVKYYTMGIAQGIACIQWFEGRDGDSGPMGLIDAKGTPRPAYTALAQMIKYFSQHPQYLGWVLLNDRHYAFVFQRAKGTVLAAWAATRTADTVDFGQPVKIVDPLTGKVTEAAICSLTTAPILLDGVPEKMVQTARENRSKPFPWGGDYTGAKSVSVTYGEKNVEKGLHTKSAESVAKDVLAYGGGARAGSVPGGTVFMVDPNFLSYNAVPIEISVVVRRNAANAPATLRLTYEAPNGPSCYKTAAPYQVPDNQQWHTAKWKIDDAQFVGQWAYSFTLAPGSYLLQSVTVTRLDK